MVWEQQSSVIKITADFFVLFGGGNQLRFLFKVLRILFDVPLQ